ncbi:unnamed protein product [Sphagnum balticum]
MFFATNTSVVKTSKRVVNFHMPTNVPINVRLDQVNNLNIFVTRVIRLPTFAITVLSGLLNAQVMSARSFTRLKTTRRKERRKMLTRRSST